MSSLGIDPSRGGASLRADNQSPEAASRLTTTKSRAVEPKQVQVSSTLSKNLAENIVDTVREPLLILGADLKVVRANRSFYNVFKTNAEETEGFLLFELNNNQWNIPKLHRLINEVQNNHTSFDNFELEHDFNVVGKRSLLLNGRPIFSKTGKTKLILLTMEDVTDRKQVEERLRELSLTDELTGLCNRRGFLTLAEDRLKLARRAKTSLWLFFADVDGLKHINDTFGHAEGDRALVEVAQILKKIFRESDIVARLSGDEFIILIVTTHPSDDCEAAVLARLDEKLNDFNSQGARNYKLSISMGSCHSRGADPGSVDSLMAKADEKLYELKKNRHACPGVNEPPEKYKGDYSKDE